MKLSKKWLNDYISLNVTDREFALGMTMSGSKVEGYEKEGEELSNIVVGKILELKKHEDSDHLWVCKVDAGQPELLQIVTGAQNLKVGDYVPVALDNSVVSGGKKIKKGKLRGVLSEGMLCSLEELGLSINDFPYAVEDGIFVLGDDCDKTLGKDIKEAIGLDDTVVEFEITSNRPDCLSVIGLAREASATFGVPYNMPEIKNKGGEGEASNLLKVRIDAPDKCYRYAGAVVKNVKIEPSPRWMRERLRASGVRPINNIVDITNYVMLEFGQPMHAFDLRYLDGAEVIVRTAKEGEKITTLDGVERELSPEMLVIADANKPVAVAGVMGGEYSGIMDDTTTIVFESACFNGTSVRRTAKKLGLRTEASARFEKELDPNGCLMSLLRALDLVEQLGAGEVVSGVVDAYPKVKESVRLPFRPDYMNEFIGINVSREQQIKYLESLDIKVEGDEIIIPTFRGDLQQQADIAEEIARLYGYENIPDEPLKGVAVGYLTDYQQFLKDTNNLMLSSGLTEIITYSFISPKAYDKICLPEDSKKRKSIRILNPLGEDTSVMRTTALPSLLTVLSHNYNNRNEEAAVYEIATEYEPWESDDRLATEIPKLMIGLYGANIGYYELKGIIEEYLEKIGVSRYDVRPVKDNPSYHPGRTAEIVVDGKAVCILGEIHPKVLANYEIGTRVYAAEVDLNTVYELRNTERTYKPLPKFPSLKRDIAVVCDKATPVLSLQRAIENAVGKNLESVKLFDVYQGEQIEKDKKSVAFSLTLRAADRTLTDEEADSAVKKALNALSELGAVLR
ncbi:MAG: phenylalanine--tRNA ligase subunit beta [Clostridiales bacterium]|jgi:phenylalanyl-tRNA synthetase beta chain|nr:phenylalanine--tRNA ligase subunit beta [Clostridiales bacterium]HQA05994.1 phenylalanine--tRNA ligase subunit beta [Clostridiales bacterium]